MGEALSAYFHVNVLLNIKRLHAYTHPHTHFGSSFFSHTLFFCYCCRFEYILCVNCLCFTKWSKIICGMFDFIITITITIIQVMTLWKFLLLLSNRAANLKQLWLANITEVSFPVRCWIMSSVFHHQSWLFTVNFSCLNSLNVLTTYFVHVCVRVRIVRTLWEFWIHSIPECIIIQYLRKYTHIFFFKKKNIQKKRQ